MSFSLAALPMYDLPEAREATDALWDALAKSIRDEGVNPPLRLTRGADATALWRDPRLLLAQTCGWPYTASLRGKVRLVATPVYAAEGCAGAFYRSVLLARRSDSAPALAAMRGRRAAINDFDSQSGHHALRAMVAPLAAGSAFFGAVIETGAHRRSAEAVASGAADVCALDCVTWAMLRRHASDMTKELREIGWSDAAPGLPLITAADAETTAALRRAVLRAFTDPATAQARSALLIAGAQALDDAAYDAIPAMGAQADALGLTTLAP